MSGTADPRAGHGADGSEDASPAASMWPTATPSTATCAPAATTPCARPSTEMKPEDVHAEVKAADAARSGRRRLPGRREVGLLPARRAAPLRGGQRRRERAGHLQGPAPHGARSPPADRGRRASPATPSARRRASCTCGARWPWPRSGSPQALNDAYAKGYVGKDILGSELQRRHHADLGRRRLHRRRGDRPHREPRGRAGHAPAEAALLPGRQGPLHAADDREQRRDAVEPAVDRRSTAATPTRQIGAADLHRHAHVRGVGPREPAGRLRGRPRASPPSASCSRRPSTAAASGPATSSRRSSPAAPRRRGSSRSTSTCRSTSRRSTRPARCSGRAPSSSWTTPPTW